MFKTPSAKYGPPKLIVSGKMYILQKKIHIPAISIMKKSSQ